MNEKLIILNLEDNPIDIELNREAIAKEKIDCELVCVETREAFEAALDQGRIDVILADLSLPTFDGFSALEVARNRYPDTPFIFVSGTLGEEIAIEALKKGATDYVLKDRLSRLGAAVLRALKEREEKRERLQAQKALEERENTLKSIFRAAPTGIGVTVKRIFTQANDRLLEMVGYSREELIGQNARLIYPDAEEYTGLGREMDQLLRRYGTGTMETRWKRKEGKIIDVLLSSSPIDPADWSLGVTFTALDITERKRIQKALRRSEERQSKLIQQTFDIIYETDELGNIKNVSPQTMPVFGIPPEEMIGRHFQEFVSESDRERVMGLFRMALNGNEPGTIEFQGKMLDGKDVHCELKFILEEVDGHQIGTFGVIRDLTEKHKMEARLQQAQKMEAIGTLAGGIAHDFNNILGAITGYAQLALFDISEDSPLHYKLDQVLKASDRARDLVKQILAFSRQSKQEKQPIQVLALIKETLKLLRASLPKTIDIKEKSVVKESTIFGDPTQIHQVLMNLFTNASQAMAGGKGVIEVSLEEILLSENDLPVVQGLSPGPYLRLMVKDTGQGIEPAILPRIFDPFFTTKGPGEGTGMGLAVVHGIVTSHGGEVSVYSEPGKGSAFRIYLPLIKTALAAEEKTRVALPMGKERLLFVDDEPDLVESWVWMLGHLGYQVTSRESSREALELIQTIPDQFDLMITDQTMSQMTGIELAREALKVRPDLPIILCSGFSQTITPEGVKAVGIREFLMKPILIEELALAIRRVLERANG